MAIKLLKYFIFNIIMMSASFYVDAQVANPFGLVYEDAISENLLGAVNIQPVHYQLNGIEIAANIYTPAGFDKTEKTAAIVVAHPNGGVKEQVSGLYAQLLAHEGYIVIVADASFQGASGGFPRNADKPQNRVEDIRGMADFISQFPGVDADQIGLLGICGGGGYALKAAQTDKRFKAVATLSMFNSGIVRRNGFMNSAIATLPTRLQEASEARSLETKTGEILYTAAAIPTDEEIAKMPFDLYREGFQYYLKSHAHPNSTFKYTTSSLLDLVDFDAEHNMDLIEQPLLMIAGTKADTKYMTDAAFEKATNAANKKLVLIEGATHIQTYYVQEYVAQAFDALKDFFNKNI